MSQGMLWRVRKTLVAVVIQAHRGLSDQGGLELIAFHEIVSGHDRGNSHLASSLLQVHVRAAVLAGGGEGTDGEGRHVAFAIRRPS